ncbi:MAG: protein kinase [Acidobacteria bacterium]|nr:protein kinase [Acidobacteriota bacterium]
MMKLQRLPNTLRPSFFCIGPLFLMWINTFGVFAQSELPSSKFDQPIEIHTYKYQKGDDARWAAPDFDDSGWSQTIIKKESPSEPLTDWQGYFWFRAEVTIPPAMIGQDIAFSYQKNYAHQAVEVFLNGVKVGSCGRFPPAIGFENQTTMVVPIPAHAVNTQGKVKLAFRAWAPDDPLFGTARLQFPVKIWWTMALETQVLSWKRGLMVRHIVPFILSLIFALVGIYHYVLYRRRQELTEYFWFSLTALGFAGNTFITCFWADFWVNSPRLEMRLMTLSQTLTVLMGLQFVLVFFQYPTSQLIRWYQVALIGVSGLVVIVPDRWFHANFQFLFYFSVIGVVLIGSIIYQKVMQRYVDSIPLGIGIMFVVISEILEVVKQSKFWHYLPEIDNYAQYGFASFLFMMAFSLSNRFSRVYSELDALNQDLERKVIERTEQITRQRDEIASQKEELEQRKTEVEAKNQELDEKVAELTAAQKQANRIFSALAQALPGTILDGKYQLAEKIGTGGFGAVFRATQLNLNRSVAVKVFRPAAGNDSEDAIERFRREGVSASRVNHPNAISIVDSGVSSDGIAYLVMELLNGHTLTDELRSAPRLSVSRSLKILIPVCDALSYAHSVGIIHRDIKPDNIFINQSPEGEVVKVLDFGIAKLIGAESGGIAGEQLTGTGLIVGTPAYMPPERLSGKPYDGRADVYSIGIIMFQMIAGQLPFAEAQNSLWELILAHTTRAIPSLRAYTENIPEELETLVYSALAKAPEARPSARELAHQLSIILANLDEVQTHQVTAPRELRRISTFETTPLTTGHQGEPRPTSFEGMSDAITVLAEKPDTTTLTQQAVVEQTQEVASLEPRHVANMETVVTERPAPTDE